MLDFFNATDADLDALGWGRWSKDTPLRLCPEGQYAFLPDGIALHSIGGAVAVKGRDYIDQDTRGGMLAYGIIPGKTRTEATAEQVASEEAKRRADFATLILGVVSKTGVFDLASGRMLHGDEADQAMRRTFNVTEE